MAEIILDQVTKRFPNGALAVDKLSLDIADGEFVILVGPSRSGKSTTLKMIAGLEDITSGELRIGGAVANDKTPKDRDVAMVFQSYALYPHMTVRDNLGFALKLAKTPKNVIDERVTEAARILDLTQHLDRRPANLSGSQRQRVAMGRAIVRDPAAFLMDEPPSDLDAKLRVEMRSQVSRIQRRLGTTMVYVTHDRTEAMTLGDRLAVMRTGVLQQVASPQELYERPANLFVAGFIGSPAMNLMRGTLEEGSLRTGLGDIRLAGRLRQALEGSGSGREVIVGIRPENFEDASLVSADLRDSGLTLHATVDVLESLGSEKFAHFSRELGQTANVAELEELASDSGRTDIGGAAAETVVARLDLATHIKEGQDAQLWVNAQSLHVFDPATGKNIALGGHALLEESLSESEQEVALAGRSPADVDRLAGRERRGREISRGPGGDGEPLEEQSRYVNLWFVTAGAEPNAIRRGVNLAAGSAYRLRLSIGERDPCSIDTTSKPFPSEHLPPSETGNWLEVALASADFEVPSLRLPLFLPTAGSAWVCPCTPGDGHTCTAADRRPYLDFDVVAPPWSGSARLRVALYCNRNVVQAHVVKAEISATEMPGVGTSSFADYTLTTGLVGVGDLPTRALSIITNEQDDASHLIMFNGDRDETVAFYLTEAQMDGAVTAARQVLYEAHTKEFGGALGAAKQRKNLYDARNAKSRDGFKADLSKLAEVGRLLWDTLFGDQRDRVRELRRTALADPTVIQIARAGRSNYVFPWALLYEIPIEPGDPEAWTYCPIVEEWDPERDATDQTPSRCPHERKHDLNTLCPYGLWGIRHVIEQPPSVSRLIREVATSSPPPQAVMVTSKRLDADLTKQHVSDVNSALSGFVVHPADSRKLAQHWLDTNAMELVYFYCHGLDSPIAGTVQQPYLGIGERGRLLPGDLGAWFEARWQDDHWLLTPPLVFINGCHTIAISPRSLVQFVDAFAGVHAAGVVGTEVTLNQRVASEAGKVFLTTLRLTGENIGSALRAMRLHLLRKGNVMGLAYTAYCSANLEFTGIPVAKQ